MGVKQLWNILEPVKEKQTLSDLTNKTLCVDLSFWICEALQAKHLCQHVNKPHLRNLLLRLLKFTEFRVKLVFVMDGRPPELKLEAIRKRNEIQTGGGKIFGSGSAIARRIEGSEFSKCVNECCNLLKLLGVPCIRSEGEAETLCAFLNFHKHGSVFCYKMDDVESQLDLNREKLVAFAVLVGCDYFPQGVRGVGEEKAKKLISAVNHRNLLERFDAWTEELCNDEGLSKIERKIMREALKDKNFATRKAQIVDEYYRYTETPPKHCLKTTSPDLAGLQNFGEENHWWRGEKFLVKILPLITNWQMTSSIEQNDQTLVQPQRIVKRRVQHKVECYEIEWQNVSLREFCCETFVTIERRDMFDMAYSTLVAEFNEEEALKKSSSKKKRNDEKVSCGFSFHISVTISH
ncbi:flap endonuclease GEN homolog 1-like isoform X3 [Acropora millepora]|uniref:flap endonuclease GEN homolog 1-like isoform X3 n=1 Tax=Acropora millepora TaxID=45264 RepID=UPI001CF41EC7|nr:flap endonuclease GEN homolog 1-like isoform X3 [Acropora millepora]